MEVCLASDLQRTAFMSGSRAARSWWIAAAIALALLLSLRASAERVVTLSPRFPVGGRGTAQITSIEVGRLRVQSALRPLPPRYEPHLRDLTAHPWLYLHDLGTTPLRMRPVQTLMRKLLTGKRTEGELSLQSLPELLEPGRRYSFVITDDSLNFAASRGHPALLLMSKHYFLANGKPGSVHFAGEMWLEDGRLVITDSSGTFKPTTAELEQAKLFFRDQLGLTDVVARARAGPH